MFKKIPSNRPIFQPKSSEKQSESSENQSTSKGSLTTKPEEGGHSERANMARIKKNAPENLGLTSKIDKKSYKPLGEKVRYGKRKKNEDFDGQHSTNRVKTLVEYFGVGTPTKRGKLDQTAAVTAEKHNFGSREKENG